MTHVGHQQLAPARTLAYRKQLPPKDTAERSDMMRLQIIRAYRYDGT